jgi:hypothetical protein
MLVKAGEKAEAVLGRQRRRNTGVYERVSGIAARLSSKSVLLLVDRNVEASFEEFMSSCESTYTTPEDRYLLAHSHFPEC